MSADGASTVIVVPCFNEAGRIDADAFLRLAARPGTSLLFVDDGSTDATGSVLLDMARRSDSIEVLQLEPNRGKGEAVRRGLSAAIDHGATVVGYYDADLSTPPDELERLEGILSARPDLDAVLGCRVARLGSAILRSPVRHYLGRLYATVASIVLGLAVYDTQCGAKLMRVSPTLVAALDRPFRSRWSFDVELLQRLLVGRPGTPGLSPSSLLEVPLDSWHHVEGSKIDFVQAATALVQLLPLWRGRLRTVAGPSTRRPARVVRGTATPTADESAGAVVLDFPGERGGRAARRTEAT